MLVGPKLHLDQTALFQAIDHKARGDAGTGSAVAFIAHGGDQQMGFVFELSVGGCDRIGACGQGAQHRFKLRCGKTDWESLE